MIDYLIVFLLGITCNVNNWSSDMKNLCEQLELDIYESKQPVLPLLVKSNINKLHQNNWLKRLTFLE